MNRYMEIKKGSMKIKTKKEGRMLRLNRVSRIRKQNSRFWLENLSSISASLAHQREIAVKEGGRAKRMNERISKKKENGENQRKECGERLRDVDAGHTLRDWVRICIKFARGKYM